VQGPVKEAWKTAPVHYETCGVPMYWHQHGYDFDFILEQGLKYHGTYFMPKSTRLPEVWMDKLSAFCRKLGYRYVLRQAIIDCRVAPAGSFKIALWIDNVGIAPIYRKYELAIRLRQGEHDEIVPFSDIDIRKWLPGDEWIERTVTVLPSIQRGWCELSVGLIDPATREAKVSFAVEERYSDRWSPIHGIEIV
jgi:hypothetical protein